jgi:hypothetical protein
MRVNTLNAGNIEPKLIWVRAALVMGVDAACSAEVVLRRMAVPRVDAKGIFARRHPQSGKRSRSHNRAFALTKGTVAAAQTLEAIRQINLEMHGSAMAGSFLDCHVEVPSPASARAFDTCFATVSR